MFSAYWMNLQGTSQNLLSDDLHGTLEELDLKKTFSYSDKSSSFPVY